MIRSDNVVAGVAVIMADKVVPVVKAEEAAEEEEDLVDPQDVLRVFKFLVLILSSIIDICVVHLNLNLS